MNKDIVREVTLSTAKIRLTSDGIVRVLYLENSDIDVAQKKEHHVVYQDFTKGVKHPFIFEAESYVSITKEAKEFGIEIELSQPFLATAIVVQNVAYKLVADFYFNFYKPKVPYKVFSSVEKAEKWLIEYRDNPESRMKKSGKKISIFSM